MAPPHTINAAAQDLLALHEIVEPEIVFGHSFGGKVALRYANNFTTKLRHVFLLDSHPGARPNKEGSESIVRAINVLRHNGGRFRSRQEVQGLAKAHRLGQMVGAWLGTNLVRDGESFRVRLDLDAIEALLDDYFLCDEWTGLGQRAETQYHLVIADRSTVFSQRDREDAFDIARRKRNVHVHVLADASHWLHVDASHALLALIEKALEPLESMNPTDRDMQR